MSSEGSWGVTPVPERLRTLSGLDLTLLWGNLGVSLLVIVAASFLVPAMSLPLALLAILVGSILGNLMLGAAGMIGADGRVPAMVLMRAPLGRRGSYAATGLNVAQCLGWATFEIIIIATAASALSDELFGVGGTAAWTVVTGAVALGLALMGPIGVVRRVIRKFAVWVVLASLALPHLVGVLRRGRLGDLGRPGRRRNVVPRRRGHRDRAYRELDPARARLHALRPDARRRLPRHRTRLLHRRRLDARARRGARAGARDHRRGRASRGRRRGGPRQRACAPRGHRGRGGRGVRERVLDGRLAAEPRPARRRSGCSSPASPRSRRSAR